MHIIYALQKLKQYNHKNLFIFVAIKAKFFPQDDNIQFEIKIS